MRAWFGCIGLLLVVAVVGLVARGQLSAGAPVLPAASAVAAPQAPATPREQVDQIKQAIDASLQQPARELPDDAK